LGKRLVFRLSSALEKNGQKNIKSGFYGKNKTLFDCFFSLIALDNLKRWYFAEF